MPPTGGNLYTGDAKPGEPFACTADVSFHVQPAGGHKVAARQVWDPAAALTRELTADLWSCVVPMGGRMGEAGYVGAEHQFHDAAFAAGWAERFTPTAPRLRLFDAIVEQLGGSPAAAGRVVELGVGPGFLAERVLASLPAVQYVAVDFSEAFLSIARGRLAPFAGRVSFFQADLLCSRWPEAVGGPVDAWVSTWALHDLGGPEATCKVYRDCAEWLAPGGLLLNGDFVKPEGTAYVFEPGRFEVSRHLEMLRWAGFEHCECLERFEVEIERPTPAQNYALLAGWK